jgi:hypothetical protein
MLQVLSFLSYGFDLQTPTWEKQFILRNSFNYMICKKKVSCAPTLPFFLKQGIKKGRKYGTNKDGYTFHFMFPRKNWHVFMC